MDADGKDGKMDIVSPQNTRVKEWAQLLEKKASYPST